MPLRDTRAAEIFARRPPGTTEGDPHEVRELRGMLRCLERLGYDLDGLLASAGLTRSDVENPDAYISPQACGAVLCRANAERRVRNLALQLAAGTPIGTTPLLDYLIVSSDSVGQGLDRLVRYLRLVNPGLRLAIEDHREPVRVVITRSAGPFDSELTVSLCVIRFNRETDGQMKAAYASFTHEPDDVADFARGLQCPVHTRASWNGWALSRAAMAVPLRRRDPALRRWLERQAEHLISRQSSSGDVRDEVRRVLAAQATTGDMRIDTVARRLATTPRTLQRRLARTGTSFEALCDDARRQAAEAYLTDTTLSIAEVAYLLGYSEPAAFHRAFRRWHAGMTPLAFRARRPPFTTP